MENLPQDVIRHIGEFGAGHREALRKVHRQIRILQVVYTKFHRHEFDVLGIRYAWVLDKWFFMNSPLEYSDEDEYEA